MNQKQTACSSELKIEPLLRVEELSFEKVPAQSKLFLDYLKNPRTLNRFYPSIVQSHAQLAERVPEVLQNCTIDRNVLADALRTMNKRWQANDEALQNIEKLREQSSVAVVTGQQAGIFTGPLYTIHKAISAVKVAACLRGRGINAVPVFWIATEDHDFAEVAKTYFVNRLGELRSVKIETDEKDNGLPVGKIVLNDSINTAVDELFAELPHTEFSDELQSVIREAYQPGKTMGDAFARVMLHLFRDFGLVLLDPLDDGLKRLAAPIYLEAIEKSAEITTALTARSRELETAGYHAQVFVEEDSFPLFWIDDEGKRHALRRVGDNAVQVKNQEIYFKLEELKTLAETEPSRLSPNATLRSVVQDFLLPTVAYFGGAAEIAYTAQNTEVYRILNRPATPMLPRVSVTIVEPHINKILKKYELNLQEFFAKPCDLFPQIVEQFLNSDTPQVFAEVEEIVQEQLNRLDKNLSQIEPTLAESLARRRPKILYHLGALRTKFYFAEMKRNETVQRQLETACAAIFPHKSLQERSLNITSLLARHGDYLLHWLWQAVNVDSPDHQIVYL